MEVSPPLLVRDDAMFGTAQLPKFREDQFCGVSGSVEHGNLRLSSKADRANDRETDVSLEAMLT